MPDNQFSPIGRDYRGAPPATEIFNPYRITGFFRYPILGQADHYIFPLIIKDADLLSNLPADKAFRDSFFNC